MVDLNSILTRLAATGHSNSWSVAMVMMGIGVYKMVDKDK